MLDHLLNCFFFLNFFVRRHRAVLEAEAYILYEPISISNLVETTNAIHGEVERPEAFRERHEPCRSENSRAGRSA
jgi:hypothetical protein